MPLEAVSSVAIVDACMARHQLPATTGAHGPMLPSSRVVSLADVPTTFEAVPCCTSFAEMWKWLMHVPSLREALLRSDPAAHSAISSPSAFAAYLVGLQQADKGEYDAVSEYGDASEEHCMEEVHSTEIEHSTLATRESDTGPLSRSVEVPPRPSSFESVDHGHARRIDSGSPERGNAASALDESDDPELDNHLAAIAVRVSAGEYEHGSGDSEEDCCSALASSGHSCDVGRRCADIHSSGSDGGSDDPVHSSGSSGGSSGTGSSGGSSGGGSSGGSSSSSDDESSDAGGRSCCDSSSGGAGAEGVSADASAAVRDNGEEDEEVSRRCPHAEASASREVMSRVSVGAIEADACTTSDEDDTPPWLRTAGSLLQERVPPGVAVPRASCHAPVAMYFEGHSQASDDTSACLQSAGATVASPLAAICTPMARRPSPRAITSATRSRWHSAYAIYLHSFTAYLQVAAACGLCVLVAADALALALADVSLLAHGLWFSSWQWPRRLLLSTSVDEARASCSGVLPLALDACTALPPCSAPLLWRLVASLFALATALDCSWHASNHCREDSVRRIRLTCMVVALLLYLFALWHGLCASDVGSQ